MWRRGWTRLDSRVDYWQGQCPDRLRSPHTAKWIGGWMAWSVFLVGKASEEWSWLPIYIHIHPCTNECTQFIQGESLARGPKLLSIKIMLLGYWLDNLYTHTGNDVKQDLLIIDAETGLLSHPSILECVSPNSGILFPKCRRWRLESLSCSIVRGVFLYTLPFNRPQRKKSAGVRSASPCL